MPRSLIELLNETFGIYGAHLKKFLYLVAIVQVPLGLLIFLHTLFDPSARPMYLSVIASSLGTIAVYGAASYLVALHKINDPNIEVWACYQNGFWFRVKSMISLGAILAIWVAAVFGGILFVLGRPMLLGNAALTGIVNFVAFGMLWMFLIWLFTSIPAAAISGFDGALAALRHTYGLVFGSKWRIFGIFCVLLLVTFGLSIVITIPFALMMALFGTEQTSTIFVTMQSISSIFVETLVLPVLFIGGTLLYIDLRVRKEQFSVSTLRQEIKQNSYVAA
ncbi:MAG: hypothetical protein QGF12_09115 [SAR202 cluster bacterium]|nr:hypothetical protein [SAR202 cluster bacterium]